MSFLGEIKRRKVFQVAAVYAVWVIPLTGPYAQSGSSAGPNWAQEKQQLVDLGNEYESGLALYEYFARNAEGPGVIWDNLPDWSGLWEREASPFVYDPDQTDRFEPTAVLKGESRERTEQMLDNARNGNVYDEISACGVPRGYPGNLRNPDPWEFAILPHQTWMLMEVTNEVRRIYTDGRGHLSERMRYPTYDGDSIGFWDRDKLIVHTNDVREGWLSRLQPYLSDALEGVEIWDRIDEETIQADVWLYDSKALAEPWFTRQIYKRAEQTLPSKPVRIHYWECGGQNNQITLNEEGGSTFTDFDFTDEDDDLYD